METFELWLQMNLALLIEQHGNVFDLLNEEVHQRIKQHDDFESVHLFNTRLYNRKKLLVVSLSHSFEKGHHS